MGKNWDRSSKRRDYGDAELDGASIAPRRPVDRARPTVTDNAQELDATVKWFKADKGFGFVALDDDSGDAFFHIKVIESQKDAKLSGFALPRSMAAT
jgi:cold shock protein